MDELFMDEIAKVDETAHVEWVDVEKQADSLFNVWVGSPEKKWAKTAWEMLTKDSLTSYSNKNEYYTVLFRFMVLAAIYHDFCEVAFDEHSIDCEDLSNWCGEIDIEEKIIWQLYGKFSDMEIDGELELGDAIAALMNQQHSIVVNGLRKGFGSDNRLYASLAKSIDLDEDEDDNESDVWEVTDGNATAYSWVDEGCLPLHW